MSHGGVRTGAGRPAGRLNDSTIKKKAVESALHERIMERADEIISNQLQLSRGHSYLFRIDQDDKGRKQKPVLVTNPEEIIGYLSKENDISGWGDEIDGSSYYYVTTEKPDNKAIDSMLDRVFGRATQKQQIDHTTKGEKINDYRELSIEELSSIASQGGDGEEGASSETV